MWLTLLGLGAKAAPILRKYWLYFLVGLFVFIWSVFTITLYNSNQNLHEEIGAANANLTTSMSATKECISQRENMDKVLEKLKRDIARIQASNLQYKNELEIAGIIIQDLEGKLTTTSTEIDNAVIPEACEDVFDWMRDRAVK